MLSRKKTLVLLLALIFLGGAILFGYRHWVDTQQSTDMTVTSSAQPLQNETINGIEVPPEPDPELNNATLAGIDVNSNGVRDDVERAIVSRYATNVTARTAALESARGHQRVVTASQVDQEDARSALSMSGDAGMCAARVFRLAGLNATEELNETFALTYNTPERLTAKAAVGVAAGAFIKSVTTVKCN